MCFSKSLSTWVLATAGGWRFVETHYCLPMGAGSVGEEQLQALLTSRLSGNVPPPPPLPGSPYLAGMGGRGPQGRGGPLAPEIFQPIPGGLPSRSSMPPQLGVQRGRYSRPFFPSTFSLVFFSFLGEDRIFSMFFPFSLVLVVIEEKS
jgi:hypothetical protein